MFTSPSPRTKLKQCLCFSPGEPQKAGQMDSLWAGEQTIHSYTLVLARLAPAALDCHCGPRTRRLSPSCTCPRLPDWRNVTSPMDISANPSTLGSSELPSPSCHAHPDFTFPFLISLRNEKLGYQLPNSICSLFLRNPSPGKGV